MGQNTRRISATRRASGTSNIIRKRQECVKEVSISKGPCPFVIASGPQRKISRVGDLTIMLAIYIFW